MQSVGGDTVAVLATGQVRLDECRSPEAASVVTIFGSFE